MRARIWSKGDYEKLNSYLKKLDRNEKFKFLDKYGEMGVEALSSATPKDSGKTASSWSYKIERIGKNKIKIGWYNNNTVKDVNIAVILQYGHATGTGGYVQGRDYINPAMRDIFDSIVDEAWEEVKDFGNS